MPEPETTEMALSMSAVFDGLCRAVFDGEALDPTTIGHGRPSTSGGRG